MCDDAPPAGGGSDSAPVTVGDALREWSRARDAGITPDESAPRRNTFGVLFVDRQNCGVSVAMEAIFTDLVRRRAPKLHIFCHSAGTRGEGFRSPDPDVIAALKFKRNVDVSSHASCQLTVSDLESFDLIVCSDESTRSQALFMTADGDGSIDEAVEAKFAVISSYCSQDKLRSMQFTDGKYTRDKLNFMISGLTDACSGLLGSLLDAPAAE